MLFNYIIIIGCRIYLVVLSCPCGVSFTRYPELDGIEQITSAVIVKSKSEAE